MVKVGFIVEGATEAIIINSDMFKSFLAKHGRELVCNAIDAMGTGNLLPKNSRPYIEQLKKQGAKEVYILADLDENKTIAETIARINTQGVKTIFIAVKAIEAWFLADTQAMRTLLNDGFESVEKPEDTLCLPWDYLRELTNKFNVRGPGGSKHVFASRMLRYAGFSIERAAQHPNCASVKKLVDHFTLP